MDNNKDIEQVLLNGSSIDELIKKKLDDEIAKEINNSQISDTVCKITDFKKVPVAAIFSKLATYLVFNRITKQQAFINGIQAESLIGLQSQLRDKLLKKLTDSFLVSHYFVKFHSAKVNKSETVQGD